MEIIYQFDKFTFDKTGYNKQDNLLFLEKIDAWELDFHQQFIPYCASHLFANSSTMLLIARSMDFNEEDRYDMGMDLINGEIDIDTNMAIEEYSNRRTIYALGSKIEGNEDEPLHLIIDDSMSDGTAILKYIPDDDEEEEMTLEPTEPIGKEKVII